MILAFEQCINTCLVFLLAFAGKLFASEGYCVRQTSSDLESFGACLAKSLL